MLFSKMNGLGNDYIFFDSANCKKNAFECLKKNIQELTILLSNRNFGIGADGVVLIEDSSIADAKMRIFNADGSEGNMCGNALRCVGKILSDRFYGKMKEYSVETRSGIKHLKILDNSPVEAKVLTKMGMPNLVKIDDGVEFYDVGNPHAVFFVDELDENAINRAKHLSFCHDVNAEAVMLKNGKVQVRVWERGSGETLACGTGATCVAYSVINKGLFPNRVEVCLKGGVLTAFLDDDGITIIGKANLNYIGEIELDYYGKN